MSVPNAGNYWLKATATQNTTVARDSVYVCIRETTTVESRPAGIQTGINYIDDQTATLVIWAPYKNNIFVVGDFNGWYPDNAYHMKKDGNYYWLTINNLVPQKEYIYQYLIDGNLQIADAYTDKVSDPDDHYISSTVYPNLLPYPSGKAVDQASVLQTAQTPYHWTTTSYTIPPESKLSVYELLIRDYTEEGTYKAVQAKLEYLKRLGINTIELMPVTEFEGNISWGYNVNFYFAPDKAYGTKNDLKALIDEAHKQGFIVIQDIVLNHAFNSNPFVKMYWNSSLNKPAANNPWFNETSPNPVYYWGSDFNHESQATKDFVDRVNKYWMTEYKVDGFRFDFTKGFTNTPGDGGAYDASRIAILERMASKIWTVNPKAIVILEHFTANNEEQELTAYGNGMMVWGNTMNSSKQMAFNEAAMGYNDNGNSDFSWASYQKRGFSKPGLMAYMESHDEERQMFKTTTYGNASGTYNTKELETALDRSKLTTAFFMSLAGPKMIWQFGELGYDYTINQCEDGSTNSVCRTFPKPIRWDYLDDPQRQKLFDVYSAMLRLRSQFDVFTSGKESLSLGGVAKTIQLTLNDHNITLIGNFGVTPQQLTVQFQHTGTWNEFFSGASLDVTSTTSTFTLNPGEYRMYSDKELPAFKDLATSYSSYSPESIMKFYPNPVSGNLYIESANQIQKVVLFSMDGKTLFQSDARQNFSNIDLSNLKSGIYIVKVLTDDQVFTQKIVKN
jgi:1,4-alpha-glucan branching enzyme